MSLILRLLWRRLKWRLGHGLQGVSLCQGQAFMAVTRFRRYRNWLYPSAILNHRRCTSSHPFPYFSFPFTTVKCLIRCHKQAGGYQFSLITPTRLHRCQSTSKYVHLPSRMTTFRSSCNIIYSTTLHAIDRTPLCALRNLFCKMSYSASLTIFTIAFCD